MSTPRLIKRCLFTTPTGRIALVPYRFWHTVRKGGPRGSLYWRWLFGDREVGNYSYRLTDRSKSELCALIDAVTEQPAGMAWQHLQEFEQGGLATKLGRSIDEATAQSPYRWSQNPHTVFDQRIIYYLTARALRPKFVFQSGTSRGVGACLLAAALIENEKQGYPGRVVSTDIDPEQGYGIQPPWSRVVSFVPRDSVAVLEGFEEKVELYVHDTAPGQLARRELAALEGRLASGGILLSTWATDITRAFADRCGGRYWEWQDEPSGHWCKGARMAIFKRQGAS